MYKPKYKTYYLTFIGDYNTVVKVRAKNLKAAKIKASNLFAVIPASKVDEKNDDIIDWQGYEIGGYTSDNLDIYEKASDLYDAANKPADQELVEHYKKFYNFEENK